MTWDYAWQLGPKGGTLSDLSDYCTFVRLQGGAETIGAKRGNNVATPYRHGTLAVVHKFNTELLIPLEVSYRLTDASGAVTDPDGEVGHIYANKATVENLLFGSKGLATLRRTIPADTLEAYVEPTAPSVPSQNRLTYLYVLRAPEGFWRSTTQSTDSTSPITVGGNAPVSDAIIEMGNGTLTMGDGSSVVVAGAAGTVSINLEAGTITYVAGGADASGFVSFSRPYRVILEPGTNTFTGAATFKWYNKWR